MKINVTVKYCNLRESIKETIRDEMLSLSKDEINELYEAVCSKYIRYGEYLTVEFDLSGKESPKLLSN